MGTFLTKVVFMKSVAEKICSRFGGCKYWSEETGLIEVFQSPSSRHPVDAEKEIGTPLENFGEALNGWMYLYVAKDGRLSSELVASGEIQELPGKDFEEFLSLVGAERVPRGLIQKMIFRFKMQRRSKGKREVRL